MTHSIIPPSSAGIWGKPGGCTGWVHMTSQHPQLEATPESMEGDAAHELAALYVDSYRTGQPLNIPEIMSNGVPVDEEMIEAAELYSENIISVINDTGITQGRYIGVEQPVSAPMIHAQSFGTIDAFLFDPLHAVLHMWDFKYGYDIVNEFENWQLINYAAGLVNHLDIDGLTDQHIKVRMNIVQPRGFHRNGPIRTWQTTMSNLRGYWNILHNNAHAALSENAVVQSGSHCKHCSARHACPAALQAGTSLYEAATAPVPIELSDHSIGVQLTIIKRAIQQLEALKDGYEEQVKIAVKSGKQIPGWIQEPSYGRLKWNKSPCEIIALGKLMGHDLQKHDALITPTQAIKSGVDETVIKAYSERPTTGIKIVPDDGSKAKKIFN